MRRLLATAGLVLGVLALAGLGTAPLPEQALGQQACTGDIVAPSGPGLGVEPDPDKIARFRV